MSQLPIADYALLSDCRSGALVSRDGSIDWLCLPRFDSPSVFGRILDDAAGHWSIRPAEGTRFESNRRYLDGSMVLETTFTTEGGSAVLTDALAVGHDERGHRLGADAVSAVMRRVVGIAGSVELVLDYAPRPEYAVVTPTLHSFDGGVTARTGTSAMALSSTVPLDTEAGTASAQFTLRQGESASFALQYAEPSEERPRVWTRVGDTRPSRRHRQRRGAPGRCCIRTTRALGGSRPPQRPRVVRADLLPDRCDRRRAHDIASRGAGRLTQLGLPLRVGA